MSETFSNTKTQTFTVTHARYLASKVATDLKRIQRFYGTPGDTWIADHEAELIELLKNGYISEITYGFKKNGNWIEPTLRYTANELASLYSADDDPGKIVAGKDVSGANFSSYLCHSSAYFALTTEQQENFDKDLAVQRTSASQPGITGYLVQDKNYHSGGTSLNRSSVKSY